MIKCATFSEIFISAMYQKRDKLRIKSATFYLCQMRDICHMVSASEYFYVRSIHHSLGIQPVIFYNLCCRAFDTLVLIISFKGCRAFNTGKSRAFDMSRLLCVVLLI